MKRNYFKVITKSVLVCALAMFISSCEGEEGVNGLNGSVGASGENGVGFEELTKNGTMTFTFTGTRSDDVAFSEEVEMKFSPVNLYDNSYYEDGSDLYFDVTRFLYAPDSNDDGSINLELGVIDAGLATQAFEFEIDMGDFYLISDDLKYFYLGGNYDHNDIGVSEFSITNYSFDDATNNLKYSFSMKIAGVNNNTGNDLTVSGVVDVFVLEALDNNF